MTTPAASASASSHTPRRSLARPGAGMHTPTPGALRKPTSSPVPPNHSDASNDTRTSATPTSARSTLPRPSLGARKSISNLRASLGPPSSSAQTTRSATPDGLNLRASLPGPSTPSSSRTSMSLSKTPLASSQLSSSLSSSHRVHTPTPAARSGRTSSRFEPPAAPGAAPPVPSLDARYMRQIKDTSAKEGLKLTLDDLGALMQIREGKEDGYRGILRFLGEIQGKGTVVFAGLELVEEWQGLGKNDGTVGSMQYFATSSNNGIFLLPSRLRRVNSQAPTDAVARPQSALSGRSSRASESRPSDSDVFDRPASITPARRRSSVAPSTSSRPASVASIRPSSRLSLAPRPDSSLGSSTPAKTPMRTAPRKSMFEELREDSEAQRRAQASAENIAAAQGRITAGSRAAELMKMTARDIAAKKEAAALARQGHGTPIRPANAHSPLKDALTDRRRAGRASLGSSHSEGPLKTASTGAGGDSSAIFRPRPATPVRMDKASSEAGRGMLPPVPPLPRGSATAGAHLRSESRLSAQEEAASTRSQDRAASSMSQRGDLADISDDIQLHNIKRARSLALLEQMDLDATPRRSNVELRATTMGRSPSISAASDRSVDGIAEGVVPLSLYEAVNADLLKKDAELSALRKERNLYIADLDKERRRLKEDAAIQIRSLEEEQELERNDEKRRRAESEGKVKQALAEVEALKRQNKQSIEEAARKDSDAMAKVQELEARVVESESLVKDLKLALAAPDRASDGQSAVLAAKDAEIEQLKGRLTRLESQMESERGELVREIEELKEAGQETIALYELRVEEAHEEGRQQLDDAEDRLRQLQTRAQEAIAAAEAQRDEALSQLSATGATPTAAIIDNESLQAQLDHARDQLLAIEDQLQEARSALRAETDLARKRKDKYLEAESKLKTEIKKLKSELGIAETQAREAKDKVEELHHALEQRSTAQEAERFELEALRAEASQDANGHGRETNGDSKHLALAPAAEVMRFTLLLEKERSALQEALDKLETFEQQASTQPVAADTELAPNSRADSDKASSVGTSTASARVGNDLSTRVAELETALQEAKEHTHDLESRLQRTEVEKKEAAAHSVREVAELEALIEAGMWQREELEAKIADLEKKLQRAKEKIAAARTTAEAEAIGVRKPEERAASTNAEMANKASVAESPARTNDSEAETEEVCDDCGSRDHTLDNCPLLDQIF
ncbi:hypothetical protein BCV69DRAFT_285330 [Microstroma glucosiphilum]|uniref:CAP-Gly domain-containing protein n=1 Tax=Pseudomicrostroma glucosiphilum TaxID=1684307 RepID=A0A316U505_9BASI|nr:hypothetical protein BCV69DRAFT_285330 [Pseudomicrostroma glucosiphilum]PWN18035.1 hypothetical protein BCV69DRAFT_285330 [Pseudomicrostroma glucosiphilum]